MPAGTQDADTVNAIFRAVHSIKGGAGAFGFGRFRPSPMCLKRCSDVRDGLVPITPPLIDRCCARSMCCPTT
jgi:two-component system chemotaxis sensor kinase CheA